MNFSKLSDVYILAIASLTRAIYEKYPFQKANQIIASIPKLNDLILFCTGQLIDEYLSAVDDVKRDKQSLGKKELRKNRREYLIKLLTPLLKLSKFNPLGEGPHRKEGGTYSFINDSIWINKELDTKNLIYDRQKYEININFQSRLKPNDYKIFIQEEWNKYLELREKRKREAETLGISLPSHHLRAREPGYFSIRELHKTWLPNLTHEKIKSKDLLDQILLCYTIKRALNGDKKAIEKLFTLYEYAAVARAVEMTRKRKLDHFIDDIKQQAHVLLFFILSGNDSYKTIQSLLDRDINYPIPKWIENFYIYYLTEYVPKRIQEIMKGPDEDFWPGIDVLLNPYSPIRASTFWKGTPKRIGKFSSYSYRPGFRNKMGPHYNLTTWLFGTPSNYMQGRFCQLLSDTVLDHYDRQRWDLTRDSWDNIKDEKDRSLLIDETIDLKQKLLNKGISQRNADIFIKHKLKGFKQRELAKEYNLSRMQIYRICKKLSSLLSH